MNIRDSNLLGPASMPDVQGSVDLREIPIQRVGIRGVRYPILWRARAGVIPSVAQYGMFVALPAAQKGTHMSRFHELLEQHREALDMEGLVALHRMMLPRLEADSGLLKVAFPLFVSKQAPVSGVSSLMDYELDIQIDGSAGAPSVAMTVLVPVTSLCPCSKTISDYGAHNQRSHVTVTLVGSTTIDPESVIDLVEAQASCELYGLLKRVDEKHVTERAYDNPKFVEDLVRDVAAQIRALPGLTSYAVEAENFESIHNHSAYARIEG